MKTFNFDNLTDSPDGVFAKMKIICQPQSSRELELIQHIKMFNIFFDLISYRLDEVQHEVLKDIIDTGVKLIKEK